MSDSVCIVPARGTEPGLPKKNFKRLDGKPLVAHTIEAALDCERIDEVVVSTESEPLAEVAREYGASVPFLRPERLAGQDALLYEVVDHAVTELDDRGLARIDAETPIVVLQPNVPFRRPRDIAAALDAFARGREAIVSVVEQTGFYWRANDHEDTLDARFDERAVRSELEPFYRETGSINVTTRPLLDRGTRVGERPGYVVTDRLSAHTIDSVLDLWLAERIADGPRIVFRVDGGDEVGMGHVSRCLTLARELDAALRCEIAFVSDASYSGGVERVRDAGYEVHAVEDVPIEGVGALDPDIVFLDVLDTDPEAVRELHRSVAAVINLEDSAGGLQSADFVVNALDADSSENGNHRDGAEYLVLREEFHGHDPRVPKTVERVLLTFGGSDPGRLSTLACRAVADDSRREYRLVLGPDFGTCSELDAVLDDCGHIDVREAVDNMGAQMAWADLAVASGGRTAYELAATGTPALVLAQNDREHERMCELDDRGVVAYLGDGSDISATALREAIDELAADCDRRRALSQRGQSFVDGAGTRRILDLVHGALTG